MGKSWMVLVPFFLLVSSRAQAPETRVVPLSSLDLSFMSAGWGKPRAGHSVTGGPLRIGDRTFKDGVGTHAPSLLRIRPGGAVRFTAWVGVDKETGKRGSVRFRVFGDEKLLFDSGKRTGGEPPIRVDLEVKGVRRLLLVVDDGGDGIAFDHADWAEARFLVEGPPPVAVGPPREKAVLLTPPPGPAPALHGPRVYGCRPGRPFLYRIPCTGRRPIRFAAKGLPPSISLDGKRGILSGKAPAEKGSYKVTLAAENSAGKDERSLEIVVGDTLALTPPMGWNSWYIHYNRVTQKDMEEAARAMISSGMADHGYQYVNIDDCWMAKPGSKNPLLGAPPRGPGEPIRPNGKFPDIAGMCRFIHSLGLKTGVYTSPGPRTCAGFEGSWKHEEVDARQFAKWGFDFLKYDWCSYGKVAKGKGLERLQMPYRLMGRILAGLDRDIVFNLCQYGMGDVWKWGAQVGGNCWRTTGDLGLARGGLLPGFYRIAFRNMLHSQYAGPGHWNDPDYILIGWVGDAWGMRVGKPTTLTPNEQYSYMSLWCLMAAPLIFSGDMTRLDAFTLNVLCNDEVIDVDQDPLGIQARVVKKTPMELVLAKPLEDGSLAVGLFNLWEEERVITVSWKELGLRGRRRVRDLWRGRNAGEAEGALSRKVPRHGVFFCRLQKEEK